MLVSGADTELRERLPAETSGRLTVISLPKSATVYVLRSIETTLSAVHHRVTCPSGNIRDDIIAKNLFEFARQRCAVAGDHAPATERNLHLLAAAGIERIVLMVRDPRDALVSWWRHLERADKRNAAWEAAHYASSGLMSAGYHDLTAEEKLADLTEKMFPAMQEWLAGWVVVIDQDPRFTIHVVRYEDFVENQRTILRGMYRFFGYDIEPTLPPREGPAQLLSAGIHTFTHFRRGVVGSHQDEMPTHLRERMHELIDSRVFDRFGWPLPRGMRRRWLGRSAW
jgi:Sulfotransferase domain